MRQARIERALADEEKDEKDAQPEFLNKFAQACPRLNGK